MKELLRRVGKMFGQIIGDVYFMQKKAVLIEGGYPTLEGFPDLIRFPKHLLGSLSIPGKYKSVLLHLFMT